MKVEYSRRAVADLRKISADSGHTFAIAQPKLLKAEFARSLPRWQGAA